MKTNQERTCFFLQLTLTMFSHACPSSHVHSLLLGELTDAWQVHENRWASWRLVYRLFLCPFLVSACTHTTAHTDEFNRVQTGGLTWTEMDSCWDQSVTMIHISLFKLLALFFLLLTPHYLLSFLLLAPLCFWKIWPYQMDLEQKCDYSQAYRIN